MDNPVTRLSLFFSVLFFTFASTHLSAEQKIIDGTYHVHYSVFPSTAISAEVASIYNLRRSEYRAIINITPQKMTGESTQAQNAIVSGSAKNLIGNTHELAFREIKEHGAVYYIAEFAFSNEEHFRFDIDIKPADDKNKIINLKFEKKFFRE